MTPPDLSKELAILLGRLVYYSGWVEHTLGELTVLHHPQRSESSDTSWGSSGRGLIKGLRRIPNPDDKLLAAISEYEELSEWRNKVIHSGWVDQGPEIIMGFHAPLQRGVPTMATYALSHSLLDALIVRWTQLSSDVDDLVSVAMGLKPS